MNLRIAAVALVLLGACAGASSASNQDLFPDVEAPHAPPPNIAGMVVIPREGLGLILNRTRVDELANNGYTVTKIRSVWTQQMLDWRSRNWGGFPLPDDERVAIAGQLADTNPERRLLFLPRCFIPDTPPPGGGPSSFHQSWMNAANRGQIVQIPAWAYFRLCETDAERKPRTDLSPIPYWMPVSGFVLAKRYPPPYSSAGIITDLDTEFRMQNSIEYAQFAEFGLGMIPGMSVAQAWEQYGFYSEEFAYEVVTGVPDLVPGTGAAARAVKGTLVAGGMAMTAYRYRHATTTGGQIAALVDGATLAFAVTDVFHRSRMKKGGGTSRTMPEAQVKRDLLGEPPTSAPIAPSGLALDIDPRSIAFATRAKTSLSGIVTLGDADANTIATLLQMPLSEVNARRLSDPWAFLEGQMATLSSRNSVAYKALTANPAYIELMKNRPPTANWFFDANDPEILGLYLARLDYDRHFFRVDTKFPDILETIAHENFHRAIAHNLFPNKICWTTIVDGAPIVIGGKPLRIDTTNKLVFPDYNDVSNLTQWRNFLRANIRTMAEEELGAKLAGLEFRQNALDPVNLLIQDYDRAQWLRNLEPVAAAGPGSKAWEQALQDMENGESYGWLFTRHLADVWNAMLAEKVDISGWHGLPLYTLEWINKGRP